MCKTCNNLKLNNDIDGIIARMDSDMLDDRCHRELDIYIGSIDLSDQWDECRLAVARGLDEPEPVLYDDDPVPTTNMVDQDTLAQVIEIQQRMDRGMSLIQELTTTRDALRVEYYTTKDRITKGGDMLNQWRAQGNSYKAWPHHAHMTNLYKHRNKVGKELGTTNDKLSSYWDHWKALREECRRLVNRDKALWAIYFGIEDFGEWLARHMNDEFQDRDDGHLRSDPEWNDRMLVSHEAYAIAHQEEQEELISYNC